MENITPLSFSCMAQFSSSLLTLPPLTLNLTFCFLFILFALALFFSSTPPPLSSLCSTVSYYNGVFFGRIRLTLPGCLCVELSDFGERGEVPEVFSLMNTLRTEEKREKSTQHSILEIKRKNKRDGRK